MIYNYQFVEKSMGFFDLKFKFPILTIHWPHIAISLKPTNTISLHLHVTSGKI
jgi:hypothetical protein